MAEYYPGHLGGIADLEGLKLYLLQELHRISQTTQAAEAVQLPVLHTSPARVVDGMVILADGTDFNPGSGAGFYGRYGGNWVKLG